MSFSQSNFYVGEYEGQVLPELVLSVPTPFDFTVSVNSSNVNLSSKLCVYYCVKTCLVNICMHTGLQLVCAWFVKKLLLSVIYVGTVQITYNLTINMCTQM